MRSPLKTVAFGASLPARLLRWSLAAVALYALIGFLIAPALIKWQLARVLTRELGREATLEHLEINPFALTVRARGFAVKEPSGGETAVGFEELYLNASVSSFGRLAPVLDEIRLVRPAVRIVRNADKSYNYTDLIEKFSAAPAGPPPADSKAGPPRFSLNNIEILDGRVEFDDRPEKKRHVVSEIHVGLPFLSSLPYATDISVLPAFSAKVNGAPVELEGQTKPFKDSRETTLRLDLEGIDLTRYADYSPVPLGVRVQRGALDTRMTLSLTTRSNLLDTFVVSGTVAVKELQLADGAGRPVAGFDALETSARFSLARHDRSLKMVLSDGAVALRGLRVEAAARREAFIEIGAIKLVDVGEDLGARSLTIGDVAIDAVTVRLVRKPDGGLDLGRLAAMGGGAPAPGPARGPPASHPFALRIRKVTLTRGQVDFRDEAVKPNAGLHVKNITGGVSEMTAAAAGTVTVKGELDGAPFEVAGRVNPIADQLFLDVRLSLRDMEMLPLSPYAATYAGYAIQKGRLSFRLNYLVDRRKLTAGHQINLNQFTFGQKIASPTATTLPVRLAVALLKDRHGVIDLDLPVSGSLDDPQFKVGRVILQVLVNLITKTATSPFALIGSAFGGGDELASVDFPPGLATITPEAGAKLATLAKALADHPALQLDIAGRASPDTDRDGLKRFLVGQRVKAQKLKKLGRNGRAPKSVNDVVVSPDEYPHYLTAVYKAAPFKKRRNFIGMIKTLPVPEMEQLLFDNMPVSDADLLALADNRAGAVKDWLAQRGGVAPGRLFLTGSRVVNAGAGKNSHPARAEFTLK